MSRKSLMMLNETRDVAKRRLTEQVRRNTDFNKNPPTNAYDNPGFEPNIEWWLKSLFMLILNCICKFNQVNVCLTFVSNKVYIVARVLYVECFPYFPCFIIEFLFKEGSEW